MALGTMRVMVVGVLKGKFSSIIALKLTAREMVSSMNTYFVAYGNAARMTHSVVATTEKKKLTKRFVSTSLAAIIERRKRIL